MCASGGLAVLTAPPANAVTVPVVSTSYYMSTVSGTTLYKLGCAKGTADYNKSGTQYNVVVFDYGKMYYDSAKGWMQTAWSAADVTLAQITSALEQYAKGYYDCTASDVYSSAVIVHGTNNYGSGVTSAAGTALARAANNLQAWIDNNIGQTTAAGGNDYEMAWSSVSAARAWMSGFDSVNNTLMYDYGDAECPSTTYGACNNGWGAVDVWYVSWGASPAVPLPEIYREDGKNADQWKWIGIYSKAVQAKTMYFKGSMTQHAACTSRGGCDTYHTDNTASAGYTQLNNALASDSRTSPGLPMTFATDIAWY
jgi:hypothetical protein